MVFKSSDLSASLAQHTANDEASKGVPQLKREVVTNDEVLSMILANQQHILEEIYGFPDSCTQEKLALVFETLNSIQEKQAELQHADALNTTKHRKLVMDNFDALNLAFGINASRPRNGENEIKYLIGTIEDLFETLTTLSDGLNNAFKNQNATSAAKHSELLDELNKLSERCSVIEEIQQTTLSKVAPPENDLEYRYNLGLGKKMNTVISQLKKLEWLDFKLASGFGVPLDHDTTTSETLNTISAQSASTVGIEKEMEKEATHTKTKHSEGEKINSRVDQQDGSADKASKTQKSPQGAPEAQKKMLNRAELHASENATPCAPVSMEDTCLAGDILHNYHVVIAKTTAMMITTVLGYMLAYCVRSIWQKLNLIAFGQ